MICVPAGTYATTLVEFYKAVRRLGQEVRYGHMWKAFTSTAWQDLVATRRQLENRRPKNQSKVLIIA